MPRIVVDARYCKACELCVPVCRQGVIGLGTARNDLGYNTAVPDAAKKCVGCALCAIMCPEGAISVEKEREGS